MVRAQVVVTCSLPAAAFKHAHSTVQETLSCRSLVHISSLLRYFGPCMLLCAHRARRASDGIAHHKPFSQKASHPSHVAPCTQGAEASGGMVNIRADEELTPEEVLQGFSEADADDVVAMSRDPQVSARSARYESLHYIRLNVACRSDGFRPECGWHCLKWCHQPVRRGKFGEGGGGGGGAHDMGILGLEVF